ncbi:MAG: hypothetical protein WCG78_00195 [Candidatus Omnitrophota bacterium]
MIDKAIKKIIAREGLIFFGCLVLIPAIDFVSLPLVNGCLAGTSLFNKAYLLHIINTTSILLYPAYLSIRFIIWALRTLRTK